MSKQDIINDLAANIEELENEYLFSNSTGIAQVEGKGEILNWLYGQYTAIVSLYEEYTDSTWISKPQTYYFYKVTL